ncbi:N-acetylmuramoyl-L-alanine amidase [Natranaerovirga hydrolytica]|uniref:N-acetylmuramoyl-L-alanine amidase n=1 Tax=Natranaerovirga hydrolytica TaxID=680378 RepID=A0A4R1N3P3_9FIRM|nr:cell wall hydrolase [Natranaerovirga hydrolytica]TCK98684.1 N-acetylmuramoyl-L-alanine amidase [Natranaerovirga hydrolytica]
MLKIKNFLQNIIGSFQTVTKKVSKKTYKNSFVVTTGAVIVAVISLSSNSFDGAGKNNVTAFESMYSQESSFEEEDDSEAKVLTVLEPLELQNETQESSILSSAQRRPREDVQLLGQESNEKHNEEINDEENDVEETIYVIEDEEDVEDKLVQISSKDYEALLRIVEAEATSEDLKGKILVANVVLNRVESNRFPNNIYDVVHDSNGGVQFSPISDGRYYSVTVTESTEEAVRKALNGEDYSQGAMYFVARAMASPRAVSWFDNNLTRVLQHGAHEFFI